MIDQQQAAAGVERERAAPGQAAEPLEVGRQALLHVEPVHARAVLLADEEIARGGLEGHAAEGGEAAVEEWHAHARQACDIDGERAEIEAIDLAGGVAAGAGAQHDQRAAVEGELQRARHAGGHHLEAGRRVRLAAGRAGERQQRAHQGAGHAQHQSSAPAFWVISPPGVLMNSSRYFTGVLPGFEWLCQTLAGSE